MAPHRAAGMRTPEHSRAPGVLVLCVLGIALIGWVALRPAQAATPEPTPTPAASSPEGTGTSPAVGLLPALAPAIGFDLVGHLGGWPSALAVRDGYIYAGMGAEMAILDTAGGSPLRGPMRLGSSRGGRIGYLVFPDLVQDVALAGDYAYVADYHAGLWVIDITQPAAPREVAFVDTPGYATGVAVAGHYVYVADEASLRIIDVSDPANAFEVGAANTPGYAKSVAIVGTTAYVGQIFCANECSASLLIMDVSDPIQPVPISSLAIPRFTFAPVVGVVAADGYAYVAAGMGGLRIIDVSDPANAFEVGAWEAAQGAANGRQVEVRGHLAFLADGTSGLVVLDVSDPRAPREVASYGAAGGLVDVAVEGDYAYLAAYDSLVALDVSDATAPALVATQPVLSNAEDLAARDGFAYVAGGENLWTVDVSDATAPTLVGSRTFTHEILGLALTRVKAANYLLVADGDCRDNQCVGSLSVVDVTDAMHPTPVGSYQPPVGYGVSVAAKAGTAYLAARDAGLVVLDLARPDQPRKIGALQTAGFAMDVTLQGDYVYVADRAGGLRIVDVSSPRTPVEAGAYQSPDEIWSVAVSGSYAYVGDRTFGLRVVDVSQPAAPHEVAPLDREIGPGIEDMVIIGSEVYAAAGSVGLRLIDVADPTAPIEVGFYDTPGLTSAVAEAGSEVYVADAMGGLFVLRRR
jgi:hypothetical protein